MISDIELDSTCYDGFERIDNMKVNNHQYQDHFVIRKARVEDAALILDFIKALAIYEHLEHAVTATIEGIQSSIFGRNEAEVIIGELKGNPVCFALFYSNYSTFLGKSNLFLEDLFVLEAYRGLGFGKAMFTYIAQLAVERGCERLDWMCLDWNTPAINFYNSLGATHKKEWTLFRLEHESLKKIG